MVASTQLKAKAVHPLARFVTPEALALLLNLQPEDIYRIDCWRYVIHIVGKGISTFVSYADLPPIIGVELPTTEDILCWRKRWQKNRYQVPSFWIGFFADKFKQARSLQDLYAWGELVGVIKFGLSEIALKWLRSIYAQSQEFYLQKR